MLFKLSILAALVAPFVSALTVNAPTAAVRNGGDMTITFTSAAGDPAVVSVFLKNPSFNQIYAVANNVNTSSGTLTFEVPAVPNDEQYTIIMTPIDNSTNVLAQTAPFNIGAAVSTASSPASTPAATASTRTATAPGSTPTQGGPLPTSSFGSTISNTNAATSAAASSTPSSTASNSAALPVRFDMNFGVVASMVLSVFAGAAVVAL